MIIDASVAVKWLIPEEDSETAFALIGEEDLIVPALIYSEVANAIWKKTRRGELVPGEVLAEIKGMTQFTRAVDDADFVARAVELGVELAHPIYDCLYLAIAERTNDILVTADIKFLNRLPGTPHVSRVRSLETFA